VAKAQELFKAGKLNEAIEALGAELRDNPSDVQRRTFLFELLCFSGNWERADKQLDILAGDDQDKRMGALLYRAAINAEKTRQDMFRDKTYSTEEAPEACGFINGKEFLSIEDEDPRIGRRLEVLAGGNYMWIPFAHIAKLEMKPPKQLRDLLWITAKIETAPAFGTTEMGEVLIPVLSPGSGSHADDAVRLGRMTVWDGDAPFGQKMLIVDDQEIPLLDLRNLEICQPAGS
jgi:type VI secretion system protein ImpE